MEKIIKKIFRIEDALLHASLDEIVKNGKDRMDLFCANGRTKDMFIRELVGKYTDIMRDREDNAVKMRALQDAINNDLIIKYLDVTPINKKIHELWVKTVRLTDAMSLISNIIEVYKENPNLGIELFRSTYKVLNENMQQYFDIYCTPSYYKDYTADAYEDDEYDGY